MQLAHDKKSNTITVQGKTVPLTKSGNGPNPCLFIGPGELYFSSLQGLSKVFTFYSLDRYFSYPKDGSRVSKEEIESLTLEKFLAYHEEARKALGLENLTVMGPSALGLVAHAYAEKYPKHVSQVIMLGTPSTTKDLLNRQTFFMQANYGPARIDTDGKSRSTIDLTTEWSKQIWARYQEAQQNFKERKEKLSGDESLIEELYADQLKYGIEEQSLKDLWESWGFFNTTMRAHFFGSEKMIVGFEMGKNIQIPTLVVSGFRDGVAPYYDLVDKIKEKEIKGPIFYVLLDAGHSPQKTRYIDKIVKTWLDWIAQHPKGDVNNEEWLNALHEQLTEPNKEEITSTQLRARL